MKKSEITCAGCPQTLKHWECFKGEVQLTVILEKKLFTI